MNAKLGGEMVMENQEMVMEKSWRGLEKYFVKSVGTLIDKKKERILNQHP